MKKLLLLTLICILAVGLFAAPRGYTQKLFNETTADGQLPGVINASTATAPGYLMNAYVTTRPGEVISNDPLLDTVGTVGPAAPAEIRIFRFGNGTTLPYRTAFYLQLGSFTTPWVAGDIVHINVVYTGDLTGYGPVTNCSWEMTIPAGTAAINWIDEVSSMIPLPSAPPYEAIVTEWTIAVNSVPVNADIFIDGVDSGFNTPYVFTYADGFDGLFTVVLPEYTWVPANYQVTDLAANVVIDFVGTPVIVVTPPLAPVYVAPVNGAIDQLLTTNLIWMEGIAPTRSGSKSLMADRDPATSYNVYFGTSATPGLVGNVLGLTYAPALAYETTYYWQIGALNTAGETLGPIWSFTTEDAPIVMYNVNVTSTPGAAIWINGLDTGFVTPHVFSYAAHTALDVNVVLAHYTFAPANYMIADLTADANLNFVGTYVPYLMYDVEITSVPVGASIWVDGIQTAFVTPYTFNWLEGTDATIAVTMDHYTFAPATYVLDNLASNMSFPFVGTYVPWIMYDVAITSTPTGQPIYVGGVASGHVTPWTFQMMEGTSATYSIFNTAYTWMPVNFPVANIGMDLAQDFVGTLIPTTYTVMVSSNPTGAEIFVDNVSTGLYTAPGGTPVVLLLPGPHVITLGPVNVSGIFYYFSGVVATGDGQIIDFEGNVPVVLSSFTATATSELFVNLVWVVQSETQVLGYNILRSNTNDASVATRINGQIINANNVSTEQTYTFLDDTEGLAADNTYYYWLQNMDMSGASDLHGPRMVTITGTVVPTLPTTSVLNNAYPNPFRMGGTANIGIKVAEGETGTITIFNLLGQKIAEKTYNAGEWNYEWNAKGNASGIYFYKLSTPSTNVTKKLVIVN